LPTHSETCAINRAKLSKSPDFSGSKSCPQLWWDYLLNLSISVSRGKESNSDSLSNCE
jgi:hypothetical protein